MFFPGTGWVPFEPTATFSNPENFQEPTTETANKPETPNDSTSTPETPNTADKTPEQDNGSSSTGETPKKKNLKQKQRPLISKFRLGFGGFLLD